MVVSPYKYLDFHSGNIVVDSSSKLDDPKCTLIDYGRMVILDEGSNQSIVNYFKNAYTRGSGDIDTGNLIEGNANEYDLGEYNDDMMTNGLLRGWTTHTSHWAEGKANNDRLQLYPLGEQAVADLDIQDIVTKFTGMLKWYFASAQDLSGERKPQDILLDFSSAKEFFSDNIDRVLKHDEKILKRAEKNKEKDRRRELVRPIEAKDKIPWELHDLEKKNSWFY